MATLSKGSLFPETLVGDLISKVRGKSSVAKFSASKPIAFTMDNEIDVVAEGGKKSHGGVTVTPVTIVPIKVEYGARISDEFMYAAEEEQINILKAFNDGFAKKVARGLDLMAFHGINPRSGSASTVLEAITLIRRSISWRLTAQPTLNRALCQRSSSLERRAEKFPVLLWVTPWQARLPI